MVKPMEEIAPDACSRPVIERKMRPPKEQALNCPRCDSTNTKFCYYNNYSLNQPRYFCKTCRRYWTEGGSLRNIPVGGGSRKNKRFASSSSSSTTSSVSSQKLPDLNPQNFLQFSSQSPKTHGGQDLNLAFQVAQNHHGVSQFLEFPKIVSHNFNQPNSSSSTSSSTSTPISSLEFLRTGIAPMGMNLFIPPPMPDTNMLHTSGFRFQEFKPKLGSSIDELGGTRYEGFHGVQEDGARLMFPFGALKQLSSTSDQGGQNKGQGNSTGYWM
ncbi:unnamed protein product [Ilex paraguariensis]|uniref:Dof zinc finger protein n=1 Tax=Ilex paraguariensis TaxID=185542 RepID=A0ABC8QWU1_9AQUA